MCVCQELAQTEKSAVADLSDETETFGFFTDEVQNSGSFSSSEGRQSWSLASGSKPESAEQATSLEQGDKQSELSDLKNYEKKLSVKWISYLKGKETNSGRYQPDARLQTEITQVSDEELNALQSFCTVKINLIHHRSRKKSSRHKKLQLRLDGETSERDALNYTVPDELLNRIYFKNMRTVPKQVTASKQHISSQCPDCNRKRAELAQSAFLKQKKTLLESLLLQEKIDEHLYTKDFLTRIGEAHQDLPRLSDDPRIIWKRLNEKSHIRYCGFERSDTEQKI
uniref:Chromosome 8 open reading frame 48 n=1 Tax=Prolemur simus TaxID=1328070 RepID=A0A8C8Z1L6_PROSS